MRRSVDVDVLTYATTRGLDQVSPEAHSLRKDTDKLPGGSIIWYSLAVIERPLAGAPHSALATRRPRPNNPRIARFASALTTSKACNFNATRYIECATNCGEVPMQQAGTLIETMESYSKGRFGAAHPSRNEPNNVN